MEQNKKVLFVASLSTHLKAFHTPYFKWFKQHGYKVHAVSKNNIEGNLEGCDVHIDLPFERRPFSFKNFKIYQQLKKIIEEGEYDIIHCHTPVASVLTRLASRHIRKKRNTKVIYTAHGFHFFKNGPKAGWLVFLPLEKFLSRYTDVLITINDEDYEAANKFHFKAGQIFKVPGVGVEESRIIISNQETRSRLRSQYNLSPKDFIIIYAAEFSHRKNHRMIIEALPKIIEKVPNVKFLFAGRGPLLVSMKNIAKELTVDKHILFLGYRTDVPKLVALSDVGISTSLQEGLPINIVEDMLAGLPVIATPCRGNSELIKNNLNGFLVHNSSELIEAINILSKNPQKREKFGLESMQIVKKYSIENALEAHANIYEQFIN